MVDVLRIAIEQLIIRNMTFQLLARLVQMLSKDVLSVQMKLLGVSHAYKLMYFKTHTTI